MLKESTEHEPSLEVIFAALADETRLQLVGLLARQDLCVCDLVDSLEDLQPKISRHLAYLRRAGIVTSERHGKWIRYGLRRPLPDSLELLLPLLREHAVPPAHGSPACCPEADRGCDVAPDLAVTPRLTVKPGGNATGASTKPRVLFLGTHNAARSQMAEGLLRHMAGDRFEVFSAGMLQGEVHPLAIEVMREIGIDITGQTAKTIDKFHGEHFDYVFGVCDHWNERCPEFPSCDERGFLAFADPTAAGETDEERLRAFRAVRDALQQRLQPSLWA